MVIGPTVTASTVVGKLLKAFLFTLTGSYARTIPEVLFLLALLATIELIICGLLWAFSGQQIVENLVWKILGFAVLFWIVQEWAQLLTWLQDGFIQAGLFVGDNGITVTDFRDPGNIADFGFSVTAVVFKQLKTLSWFNSAFTILLGGIVTCIIVVFYCYMAAQVFMALLEFAIVGAATVFLLPFLAFQKTAFIGERVFGTMVSHAVRLLYLALILNVALPIIYSFQLPIEPEFGDVWILFMLSLLLVTLCYNAQNVASGLIHGAPSLHAGSFIGSVTTVAETAAAVGAVGTGVSIAGVSLLRGGISTASAMREAAHMGVARRGGNGLSNSVIGGTQGMGKYSVQRMTKTFRAAYQTGKHRAQNP